MKYLSLFSGIEAATQAWHPLGWEPVAFSEIENFPNAVLEHHYPDVPNLGDVTKITENKIKKLGQIDLVVFGSPCQDLSVAGKRKGLDGERSGLFTNAIKIIKWARKHNGCRYALWENVPGAFSSNGGKDFGEVIKLLSGSEFRQEKYQTAGVVIGKEGLVEWRTLDAQHFGVPQRRRRIFALADFGNWESRGPILFERESVFGDSATSGEARKETPTDARECFDKQRTGVYGDGNVASTMSARDYKDATDLIVQPNLSAPISARDYKGPGTGGINEETTNNMVMFNVDSIGGNSMKSSNPHSGSQKIDTASTLTTFPPDPSRPRGGNMVVYENHPQDSRVKAMGDTCQTVSSTWGSGGGNVPFVQRGEPLPFDTTSVTSPTNGNNPKYGDPCHTLGSQQHPPATSNAGGGATSQNSQGSGWNEDVSFTLNSVDKHAVAYGVLGDTTPKYSKDVMPTLRAEQGGEGRCVAFTQNDGGRDAPENTAPTLRSGGDGGIPQSAVAYSVMPMNSGKDYKARETDVAQPIMAGGPVGGNQGGDYIVDQPQTSMQVRRLTPKECERLQGFPDDFTKIPYRKKSADDCPDGPRYKALGNSMAVPVMRWIGERINQAD